MFGMVLPKGLLTLSSAGVRMKMVLRGSFLIGHKQPVSELDIRNPTCDSETSASSINFVGRTYAD